MFLKAFLDWRETASPGFDAAEPSFRGARSANPESRDSGFASRPGMTAAMASSRGLLLVAQLAAQAFAHIGLRQLGPKLDELRYLVAGQLFAAELDDVLGGGCQGLCLPAWPYRPPRL